MMKQSFLILKFLIVCLILFSSCGDHPVPVSGPSFDLLPGDTIKRIFDIDRFNMNRSAFDKYYSEFEENGTSFRQFKEKHSYIEQIYYPDSLFGDFNRYYPSGKMSSKCRIFVPGKLLTGRMIYFDEQGDVTWVYDLEEDYAFSLDDILAYMGHEGIDIHQENIRLQRVKTEDIGICGLPSGIDAWVIMQQMPDNEYEYHLTVLNGETGELMRDEVVNLFPCPTALPPPKK